MKKYYVECTCKYIEKELGEGIYGYEGIISLPLVEDDSKIISKLALDKVHKILLSDDRVSGINEITLDNVCEASEGARVD